MLPRARAVLEMADARPRPTPRRSLAPGRGDAHTLVALGDTLFGDLRPDAAMAAAHALADVDAALVTHFPENLFADLDVVAGTLVREARAGHGAITEAGARLVALHELYGRSTTIRFRYVHDFLYGFDWARWVAAEPGARAHETPFGRAFLEHSLRRGKELLGLIERGDAKYKRLAPGEARSPFAFRRDPEAETSLLRALADADLVPLRAWEPGAIGVWNRPFVHLREEKARALGLAIADGV